MSIIEDHKIEPRMRNTWTEIVEINVVRYSEIIRNGTVVEETAFFSPPQSSFQFVLLVHKAGYLEDPHYHKLYCPQSIFGQVVSRCCLSILQKIRLCSRIGLQGYIWAATACYCEEVHCQFSL